MAKPAAVCKHSAALSAGCAFCGLDGRGIDGVPASGAEPVSVLPEPELAVVGFDKAKQMVALKIRNICNGFPAGRSDVGKEHI